MTRPVEQGDGGEPSPLVDSRLRPVISSADASNSAQERGSPSFVFVGPWDVDFLLSGSVVPRASDSDVASDASDLRVFGGSYQRFSVCRFASFRGSNPALFWVVNPENRSTVRADELTSLILARERDCQRRRPLETSSLLTTEAGAGEISFSGDLGRGPLHANGTLNLFFGIGFTDAS